VISGQWSVISGQWSVISGQQNTLRVQMGRAVLAYLILIRALREGCRRPKQEMDRIIRVFETLEPEQVAVLDKGKLPNKRSLRALAVKVGETEKRCRDDLLVYLRWVERCPELLTTDH
jgi:hypothetical protein